MSKTVAGRGVFKRLKSDCNKSDACCGVRDDCKLEPCKEVKEDCWYATRIRQKCATFVPKPPPCEENPCGILPLLDWLYYRPSDKAKRQYQKNWKECPSVKKVECRIGKLPEFPPMKLRRRSDIGKCRPPTACEANKNKFSMLCKLTKDRKSKCPYIEAPCCLVGRKPPNCLKARSLSGCVKMCCPYPAYSECCVAGFANFPVRSDQCGCLSKTFYCYAVRLLEKQKAKSKE